MRWVPNLSVSLRVSLPLTIAVLLALPLAGWGQQELRSGKKGVTVPAPITSTSVDADTQALDVAIKAGSITLSGADGAILDGANPTIKATVTGSNALKVDGSAVTQPVNGTVTVQQGTGTNLHMVCDSGCGGSAGFSDNSTFTFGTTAVNPIAGVLDDVATNAATENAAAVIRMTAQKGLHVNLRNVSGTELGTASAPFRIDPTGTTTQPISGTITANAGTNLNTSALALDATVTGRFPASFSSADAVAAQTATFLHGGMMGWNGTGWDRIQVDASKNLKVLINAAIPTGANTIGAVNLAQYTPVTGRLPVDGSGVTQPVSGTITANQGGTWNIGTVSTLPALPANQSVNVAQINGVTPLTGNGTTGTGSPRVTIASDNTAFSVNAVQSTAAATTAPWPVSNGTVTRTSATWTSATVVDTALSISTGGFAVVGLTTNTTTTITAGTLQFEASDDSGTTWFSVSCTAIGSSISLAAYPMAASTKLAWQCPIAGYDRMRVRINPALTGTGQVTVGLTGSASGEVSGVTASTNIINVVGNTAATAATGTLKVGIVGNAAGAFDSANNAAAPANVLAGGAEVIGTAANPTAATAGNMRRLLATTEGILYTRPGGSNQFTCRVASVSATTQCQAAPGAGLKAYVTDVFVSNNVSTAQTIDLVFGTGTNCGTGTTQLMTPVQFGAAVGNWDHTWTTPLNPTAANAICVRPTAATSFSATITGFIAP